MLAHMDSRSCPHVVASWAGISHLSQNFHFKTILNQTPSVLSLNSPLCLAYPAHDLLKLCSAGTMKPCMGPSVFSEFEAFTFFAFIIDFLKLSLFESCYA